MSWRTINNVDDDNYHNNDISTGILFMELYFCGIDEWNLTLPEALAIFTMTIRAARLFIPSALAFIRHPRPMGFNGVDKYLLSDCLGGPFGNKWTDVAREWNERSEVHSVRQRSIFSEWNELNSHLVVYYPIEIQELKKQKTLKLPRATQTKQNNPLQCNQCLMWHSNVCFTFRMFLHLWAFEWCNSPILAERKYCWHILLTDHTKKAKRQKRSSMHLLLYSDYCCFCNRYFSS